jgi:hypothetical protein
MSSNYCLALKKDLIQLRTKGCINANTCTMHTQTIIM